MSPEIYKEMIALWQLCYESISHDSALVARARRHVGQKGGTTGQVGDE